jgi:ribonuclease HII
MYCLGTDEAGYGPNLGPLVISATLWEAPDGTPDDGLYKLLRKVVAPKPPDAGVNSRRIVLADSKVVYSPAVGLRRLELGALAALRSAGVRATNLRELLIEIAGDVDPTDAALPWQTIAVAVPHVCTVEEVDEAAARLQAGFEAVGVRLAAIRTRAVFASEFNALCDSHDNKSNVLTAETLRLVRLLLDRCEAGQVAVACDKHGGRNCYAAALQQHVYEGLLQVVREGRSESAYRFSESARSVEIAFRVEGESRLAAALASMVSKYVRELAMQAFNEFWAAHVPELRRTAGYSTDANRFRNDIAEAAGRLALDERCWWRSR